AAPMMTALTPLASGFVGSLLIFNLLSLCAMIAGQVGSLTGLNGPNRMRWLGLTLGTIGAAAALVRVMFGQWLNKQLLPARLSDISGPLYTAVTPLRWFVEATLSKRIWPDLAQWTLLAMAVNVALLATIYALDAYLQRRDITEDEREARSATTKR